MSLRPRHRFHHRSLLQTLCVRLPLVSTSCTVELRELRRVGFALTAQFFRDSFKKDQKTIKKQDFEHRSETRPKTPFSCCRNRAKKGQHFFWRDSDWHLGYSYCHLSTMFDMGFIGISRFWLCLMQLAEFGFRKWNCFDTLVVLLQWADYAAEMMPGKLVQSGNLGILSLHSLFLPLCSSITLVIVLIS